MPAENVPQTLAPAVAAVLARARAVVEPEPFVVVTLSRHDGPVLQRRADRLHSPFLLHIESSGVSLVCRETEWQVVGGGLHPAAYQSGFRMVTLDATVGPDAAAVGRVVREHLSRLGVEAGSVPTFHREHFLVREADLDRCLAALDAMLAEANRR